MYIVFDAELAGISKSSSSVKRNGIYSPYEFVKIMEEEKGNIIRTANVNMPRVNSIKLNTHNKHAVGQNACHAFILPLVRGVM